MRSSGVQERRLPATDYASAVSGQPSRTQQRKVLNGAATRDASGAVATADARALVKAGLRNDRRQTALQGFASAATSSLAYALGLMTAGGGVAASGGKTAQSKEIDIENIEGIDNDEEEDRVVDGALLQEQPADSGASSDDEQYDFRFGVLRYSKTEARLAGFTRLDVRGISTKVVQAPQVRNTAVTAKNKSIGSQHARPHPLLLPEILALVFRYLVCTVNTGTDPAQPMDFIKVDSVKFSISQPRLYACVSVCKTWYACASPMLWSTVKLGSHQSCVRMRDILAVASPARMQQYHQINNGPRQSPMTLIFAPWQKQQPLPTMPNAAGFPGNPQQQLPEHSRPTLSPPLNGWLHGAHLRSFTVISPHCPTAVPFEEWDIDGLVYALSLACPHLEDLNLSNCTQVTDRSMVPLVTRCTRLRRLNLNRCDQVSTVTVNALANMLQATIRMASPAASQRTRSLTTGVIKNGTSNNSGSTNGVGLTVLNLSRPLISQRSVISDQSLLAVLQLAPNLTELRLRNCDLITDATIVAMSQTCGASLRALDISWCNLLTDRALAAGVAPNCPNLLSLALNGCKRFSDAALDALLTHCPDIASLSLAHLPFITDTVLASMASQLKHLTILSLNGCSHVGDSSLIALAGQCSRLTSLSLFSLNISDDAVRAVTHSCPDLVSLSISGCHRVTDAGAVTINRLHKLVSLYLNGAAITDAAVTAITRACPGIRALSLNNCTQLTDAAVCCVARCCPNLQSLSMNECGVTVASVAALLDHCHDLRELSIKGCARINWDAQPPSPKMSMSVSMQQQPQVPLLDRIIKKRISLLR